MIETSRITDLEQRLAAAESRSATAFRDGLEEAARIADEAGAGLAGHKIRARASSLPGGETISHELTGGWNRDMDAAPKDGTWVLLWWPEWHHQPMRGYWSKGGYWNAHPAMAPLADGRGPLAWMPMPLPPVPGETQEDGR